MINYKVIKPIVPGVYDENTIWSGKENQRKVKNVGIVFDYMPDQDIYKSHPIFFVSDRFKNEYEQSSLTGITSFTLIRSFLFINEEPPKELGVNYYRIEVNLLAEGLTDFLRDRTKLLLNHKALNFIDGLDCDQVSIDDYDPNWHEKLLEKDRNRRQKDLSLLGKIKKIFK